MSGVPAAGELDELRRTNENLERSTRVAWEQAEKEIQAALGISGEQLEATRVLGHAAVHQCESSASWDVPEGRAKLCSAWDVYRAAGRPFGPKR